MYTNTELMYQLQKFEQQLNQVPDSTAPTNIHYEVGYLNTSVVGPYYYVNEIRETNGQTSESFLVTMEVFSGQVETSYDIIPEHLAIIMRFADQLKRHGLIEVNAPLERPSIQLHPDIFGEFDADALHP